GVKGAAPSTTDLDIARQREVVDAFFAAARHGDFDALLAVLDPEVVMRIDAGAARPAASMVLQGATTVARQALKGLASALRVARLTPAIVNGVAGVVITLRGRPMTLVGFTI